MTALGSIEYRYSSTVRPFSFLSGSPFRNSRSSLFCPNPPCVMGVCLHCKPSDVSRWDRRNRGPSTQSPAHIGGPCVLACAPNKNHGAKTHVCNRCVVDAGPLAFDVCYCSGICSPAAAGKTATTTWHFAGVTALELEEWRLAINLFRKCPRFVVLL
jgi:hypothetical protein